MATEDALEVRVRRHVFITGRPFPDVMKGLYGGISRPDIGNLFRELHETTTYERFTSLVRQAQGSAGLMRFLELDEGAALPHDPQTQASAGRRMVRLIAGNPVTMGQMARHVPDAGSYAPITILIQEMPDGGTRVAYDSVASAIAPYNSPAATQVAEHLDAEVLDLLRLVTGVPANQRA